MRLLVLTVEINTTLPLDRVERVRLAEEVRCHLAFGVEQGVIGFSSDDIRGQELVSLQTHLPFVDTPLRGEDAFRMGAWRRHNPFEKDTDDHRRWNKEWDNARHKPF